MKLALTDAKIRGFKAEDAPYDVADLVCRGLQLRVSTKGTRTWSWVGRVDGKVKRVTLGRYPDIPLASARRLADTTRVAPVEEQPAGEGSIKTVGQMVETYLSHLEALGKSSVRNDRSLLSRLTAEYGPQPPSAITRAGLVKIFDGLVLEGKRRTANALKSSASGLLRWAALRGYVATNVLADYHERPGGSMKPRDRVLGDTEAPALWAHLGGVEPKVSPIVNLALQLVLLSAQRPGECSGARIEQFDLVVGTWRIPAEVAKNRREHLVPLGASAVALVRYAAQGRVSGPLFPAPRGKPGEALKETTVATAVWNWFGLEGATKPQKKSKYSSRGEGVPGVQRFTPHDLRRTAATGMRANGAAVSDISAYLNHTEKGVTAQVYALSDRMPEKRRALSALEAYLTGVGVSFVEPAGG